MEPFQWIRGSPLTQWSLHLYKRDPMSDSSNATTGGRNYLYKTQCHSDGRWCDLQKLDDPLSLPKTTRVPKTTGGRN